MKPNPSSVRRMRIAGASEQDIALAFGMTTQEWIAWKMAAPANAAASDNLPPPPDRPKTVGEVMDRAAAKIAAREIPRTDVDPKDKAERRKQEADTLRAFEDKVGISTNKESFSEIGWKRWTADKPNAPDPVTEQEEGDADTLTRVINEAKRLHPAQWRLLVLSQYPQYREALKRRQEWYEQT